MKKKVLLLLLSSINFTFPIFLTCCLEKQNPEINQQPKKINKQPKKITKQPNEIKKKDNIIIKNQALIPTSLEIVNEFKDVTLKNNEGWISDELQAICKKGNEIVKHDVHFKLDFIKILKQEID